MGIDPNCTLTTPGAIGPLGPGENTCFADDGTQCPVDSPNAITPLDVAEAVGIVSATRGSQVVVRTGIKIIQTCGKVIANNLDKICKSGVLIGSLFCFDNQGQHKPQRKFLDDKKTIEEITRRSGQPKPPNPTLLK